MNGYLDAVIQAPLHLLAKGESLQRIAVTGSSGYLGRKLVKQFQSAGASVLGIDLQSPSPEATPEQFCESDIRSDKLLEVIRDFKADTIVHAAFIVKPLHNSSAMSAINIDGTKNVLRIVELLRPARFLFLSSATAHGAFADNPVPLPDDWTPKAACSYQYAYEKMRLEGLVGDLAKARSEIAVSWVRPAIVGGPGMDNFLSRYIFGLPCLLQFDAGDHPLQFVHEDDVVGAIAAVLAASGRGPFNLAPPDWTPISVIAKETKRRVIRFPFWIAASVTWLLWNTKFWRQESPPGFLSYARYPWVVSSERLQQEIGYRFRYSSLETVRQSFPDQTKSRIDEGLKQQRRLAAALENSEPASTRSS